MLFWTWNRWSSLDRTRKVASLEEQEGVIGMVGGKCLDSMGHLPKRA